MNKIPAFTVLLLMAVSAVVGIVSIPMLNVQYAPTAAGRSVSVSCSWPDVSARVMEAEVTSKVEGVLSSISGSTGITSTSDVGGSTVSVELRKGTDMSAVRFEIATKIRNLYPSLPEGVSYPEISLDTRGGTSQRSAVSYSIKSTLPSEEIRKFVSERVLEPLSTVDGVDKVTFWGATPFELEITFDADKAAAAGITGSDIATAFIEAHSTDNVGLIGTEEGLVSLKLREESSEDIGAIPVKNAEGRIVHLRDIATWAYKETTPTSYYRLNGLNTIQLATYPEPNTNLIAVAAAVRDKMEELQRGFPPEISATVSYDSSQYVAGELSKNYRRTLLCILILLVFVFLVNRSWRYLFIITATLAVDILAAIALYNLFGLDIHIYTIAGFTVSLGIIIDTSIVMTDHYSYYRNRSVMLSLIGATATTIAALCMVALLPEEDKKNLADFCRVIIINLSVALLTAWLFIPSLLDKFPVRASAYSLSVSRRRRVVGWNHLYAKYISWGVRHRWLLVVLMVAAFGIPLCVLPKEIGKGKEEDQKTAFERAYNAVISWKPYADRRKSIDKVLGTSFALFHKATERSDFYREPGRNVLYIRAGMPEGCSVSQLNDVVKAMENYLSGFDQIESFSTEISSYDDALISVNFKPEWEDTTFPDELQSKATSMAINFGGANWRVWGISESSFNNNIVSGYKGDAIQLTGYNYDKLLDYADILIARLGEYHRVQDPEVVTRSRRSAMNEYSLSYDFASMAAIGISPYSYYSKLHSTLYDTSLGKVDIGGEQTEVSLRSSDADAFDLWRVENAQVSIDSVNAVKLSEIGSIQKRRTGLSIQKEDQSYVVTVGYDFLGSKEQADKASEEVIDYMNHEVMPVGYRAESPQRHFSMKNGGRYVWLLLLVVATIFVLCSMIFESLRLPLAVILLIPVSFIGVFLAFGLTDFSFDQGGFAAFVMLAGIVVNAGIYLITAWQKDCSMRSSQQLGPSSQVATQSPTGPADDIDNPAVTAIPPLPQDAPAATDFIGVAPAASGDAAEATEPQRKAADNGALRSYLKAYNHKINAILLTVISTVLGLIPFLFDGPKEVFWFAFAIGTIAGLAFSLLALILILPVFALRKGV